jgi:threonine synthase
MWRYKEVLPVFDERNIVSLGEGMTPIIELNRLAHEYELPNLLMKDESKNPTGSVTASGFECRDFKSERIRIKIGIIPTAGNAGGAMAAYCAAAVIRATVCYRHVIPLAVFKRRM